MDHADKIDYQKMTKEELLEEITKLNQQILDDEEAHRQYRDVVNEKMKARDLEMRELEHYMFTLEKDAHLYRIQHGIVEESHEFIDQPIPLIVNNTTSLEFDPSKLFNQKPDHRLPEN